MLLRRLIEHAKSQNWTAVALDFLIVVSGVFIGVQATSWANGRAEQQQIQTYLQTLKDDLVSDREMLGVVKDQIADTINRTGVLADYSRGRALSDYDNLDLLIMMPQGVVYRPYAWNRTTFSQLKSIGGVRQIRDPQLRLMIANYESMTDHLDLDFAGDQRQFELLQELSYAVIDRNYSGYADLNSISFDDLEMARTSDLYLQARDESISLVAGDVQSIRRLVSAAIAVADSLTPRVEHEIPDLIQLGADIVARIDEINGTENN